MLEKIEKLILILVENAFKYTPSGKNVIVSLYKTQKNYVYMTVKLPGRAKNRFFKLNRTFLFHGIKIRQPDLFF